VIAPWRGELEWVPLSNPALCRVVEMREDGRSLRSQRLFRGRLVYFSWLPPGSPIRGFTAHVGGRTPSRVHTGGHTGACRSFFYQVFSQLSVCMCLMAGLYCIVLYSLHGSVAYVLCIHMNMNDSGQWEL